DFGDAEALPALIDTSDRTPADIEQQVLAQTSQSSVDDLSAAIDAADWLLSRARSIHQLSRQIAIAWIECNGELDIGPMHYSVGSSTDTKCLDVPRTGNAVLAAAHGDFERFLAVLVAQPVKPATVRNLFDTNLHATLFQPRRAGRLVNGVTERVLKAADKRF